MKKLFLITFLVLFAVGTLIAAESQLPGGNKPIQTFAPDGTYAAALTTPSTTTDLSDNLMFSVYSISGTCYMRLMPTTAKSTYTKVLIPNSVWHTYAKNPVSPFLNLSGCVTGFLQRQ